MTTYYIDPELGNDASVGTSFATAWKTVTSGATAARIAPGDVIRIKSSPINSIGDAAWSIWTNTISLISAKNLTIDNCENSSWTDSTNVTHSFLSGGKQGSNFISIAIASGFTTGKVIYKTLPSTLDLSSYEQISLWFNASVASQPAARYQIKLCSDTTGDIPVDTLDLEATYLSGEWVPMVTDKGSALGSSINSIALYCTSDPGVITIKMDNIIACKASSSSDALTLKDCVGLNDSHRWYPIGYIDGTTVGIDYGADVNISSAGASYWETTQTSTTYRLTPLEVTGAGSGTHSTNLITDSGNIINHITYSGGWNRTDMSTQDGYTAWSGIDRNTTARCWDFNGKSYIDLERFIAHRYGNLFFDNATAGSNYTIKNCWGASLSLEVIRVASVIPLFCYNVGSHAGTGFLNSTSGTLPTELTGKNLWITGDAGSSFIDFGANASYLNVDGLLRMSGATSVLFLMSNGKTCYVRSLVSLFAASYITPNNSTTFYIHNLLGAWNPYSGTSGFVNGGLNISNIGLVSTDQRQYFDAGSIITTSFTHRNRGISWRISPTSIQYRTVDNPIRLKLGSQYYKANIPVTITAWVYRGDASLETSLVMEATEVSIAFTVSSSATTTNQWEQLKIQFTPTRNITCSPEIQVYSTSSTSSNVWIDDIQFR